MAEHLENLEYLENLENLEYLEYLEYLENPKHLVNTIELAAAGCVETRGRSPRMKPGSRRLPLKLGREATAETKGTQSPNEKLAKRPLSLQAITIALAIG